MAHNSNSNSCISKNRLNWVPEKNFGELLKQEDDAFILTNKSPTNSKHPIVDNN